MTGPDGTVSFTAQLLGARTRRLLYYHHRHRPRSAIPPNFPQGHIVIASDSVGDGIPDAWRQAYFLGDGTTTNSQSCATCDPDHDGFNNLQEYLAGH